mgnify:CR=1 FL=1
MMPKMDQDLHMHKWNKKIGFQLEGKTIAIIGLGIAIGIVKDYLKNSDDNYKEIIIEIRSILLNNFMQLIRF